MDHSSNINVTNLAKEAKEASFILGQASNTTINDALNRIAELLLQNSKKIITINKSECEIAKESGRSEAVIDRLLLNEERIAGIAKSVKDISKQECPVGKTLWSKKRPNGLVIERKSVPLGVLGMIYEARPNVTIDAAALALKSKNAILLRSGSDCIKTAIALHGYIIQALQEFNLPAASVQIIKTVDRNAVGELLQCHKYIDVVIPRGGRSLIERVMNEAEMPVFSHLDGLCHTFIDESAKPDLALNVTVNAKMRRTGICGATETILVHKNFKDEFMLNILTSLEEAGCKISGDERILKILPSASYATEKDWETEYLSPQVSIKYVQSLQEAISHINKYGSHHTDAILTESDKNAQLFQASVDSGIVMHNTSTQFADGGEFGMGAEIGIATGKFHARGPVGAEQLCTYKYIVHGNGQIRP